MISMMNIVPPGGRIPDGEWKSFATHAAAGRCLDRFLMDAGYLLAADPDRLLAALSSAGVRHQRAALASDRGDLLLRPPLPVIGGLDFRPEPR